jgi:hypothetical protein
MGLIRTGLSILTGGVVRDESKKQRYARTAAGIPSRAERNKAGMPHLFRQPPVNDLRAQARALQERPAPRVMHYTCAQCGGPGEASEGSPMHRDRQCLRCMVSEFHV